MEKIYTDTYDFEHIRKNGATYVDKTNLIWLLASEQIGKQFFLSRPRRFGKSLLISTLKYLFEGRRDLFKGLAIDSLNWDWDTTYPVLHLDMSGCESNSVEDVENDILAKLVLESERLNVPLRDNCSITKKFMYFINDIASKSENGKFVLLIDEYDKPILGSMGSEKVKPFQEFLKQFYTVVKETESLQRFCLLTGVSKFSKVSIFSSLNNLTDITMDARFSTLVGYTHSEVKDNFPESLQSLAEKYNTDDHGAFDMLIEMYDGYCFDESMVPVFNPVSLGRCLNSLAIKSYWFETGTPTWLMSYAKKSPINMDNLIISESQLGTFEPDAPDMIPVLFQSGYLTIKDAEFRGRQMRYKLGFPNEEVMNGFNEWLAAAYVPSSITQRSAWQEECWDASLTGDAVRFVKTLQSFFACIGYDLTDRQNEQSYECILTAILRFIGIDVCAEVTVSNGRIDMLVKNNEHVFVIELKIVGSADMDDSARDEANKKAASAAIAQIRERGYADQFRADAASDKADVKLIGISFDCAVRNIGAYVVESL